MALAHSRQDTISAQLSGSFNNSLYFMYRFYIFNIVSIGESEGKALSGYSGPKIWCPFHLFPDTIRSSLWSASRLIVLWGSPTYSADHLQSTKCFCPRLYFQLFHSRRRQPKQVLATVFIKIWSVKRAVFYDVWWLFLLCCWTHDVELSSQPSGECTYHSWRQSNGGSRLMFLNVVDC